MISKDKLLDNIILHINYLLEILGYLAAAFNNFNPICQKNRTFSGQECPLDVAQRKIVSVVEDGKLKICFASSDKYSY